MNTSELEDLYLQKRGGMSRTERREWERAIKRSKAASIKEIRVGNKVYEVKNGFMRLKEQS